jgi:hypothetical protein
MLISSRDRSRMVDDRYREPEGRPGPGAVGGAAGADADAAGGGNRPAESLEPFDVDSARG